MNRKFAALAATLVFTGSLQAHHSSSMFDATTPIRVKGLIAEVHFANPHSSIFIAAVDSNGQPVRWAVENSGTLAMTRQRGFDEESLQVGDPIEVCGYAPKRAYLTAEELAERDIPRPAPWWGDWDKVITGRLLRAVQLSIGHTMVRWTPASPCLNPSDACVERPGTSNEVEQHGPGSAFWPASK